MPLPKPRFLGSSHYEYGDPVRSVLASSVVTRPIQPAVKRLHDEFAVGRFELYGPRLFTNNEVPYAHHCPMFRRFHYDNKSS